MEEKEILTEQTDEESKEVNENKELTAEQPKKKGVYKNVLSIVFTSLATVLFIVGLLVFVAMRSSIINDDSGLGAAFLLVIFLGPDIICFIIQVVFNVLGLVFGAKATSKTLAIIMIIINALMILTAVAVLVFMFSGLAFN